MTKKKILIISYKIPYPANHGGAIAQFFFLEKLALVHDVTLCTVVYNEYQKQNLKLLQEIIPQLKIIYNNQETEYNFNSSLVNTFLKKSISFTKRIHFFLIKKYIKNRNEIGNVLNNNIDTNFTFINEQFLSFVDKMIKEGGYSHIQLEFFETIGLLPFLPEAVKKIVVHHEIRSKRNNLIYIPNNIYKEYLVDTMSIIETSFLNIADAIIVFNQKDKEFLKELESKIVVSPFGIPKKLIKKVTASTSFNKFIFIGGENHFPNKEGLEWFIEKIFIPNLEKMDWPLYIIGDWTSTTIQKYTHIQKIIFTGFVVDVSVFYENAVMLCPVISGSGIRTKILESFVNKIPVISTPFASEGLFEKELKIEHIIHFETEKDFLINFHKMKTEENFLNSIGNKGFEYFNNYFNEDELLKKRLNIYN